MAIITKEILKKYLQDSPTLPLWNGLVCAYLFDETSGDTITDYSQGGVDLELSVTASGSHTWENGGLRINVDSDGSNEYRFEASGSVSLPGAGGTTEIGAFSATGNAGFPSPLIAAAFLVAPSAAESGLIRYSGDESNLYNSNGADQTFGGAVADDAMVQLVIRTGDDVLFADTALVDQQDYVAPASSFGPVCGVVATNNSPVSGMEGVFELYMVWDRELTSQELEDLNNMVEGNDPYGLTGNFFMMF